MSSYEARTFSVSSSTSAPTSRLSLEGLEPGFGLILLNHHLEEPVFDTGPLLNEHLNLRLEARELLGVRDLPGEEPALPR